MPDQEPPQPGPAKPDQAQIADLSQPLPDTKWLKWGGLGVAALAVAIVAVGLIARHQTGYNDATTSRAAAIPDVAVVYPVRLTGNDDLVLPGQVQAWNNAAINARTNGYVREWLADIGSHVHAGQPLAVLDAPEVDQQLAQAVADYQTSVANQRLALTTAHRWSLLVKQDAVSQQESDEKQGDLAAKSALANAALANVKRLKALQGFERVYAPFDGVVTSRSAQIGALVVTGNLASQPLFTVADVHRMRIYVRVPQNYSAMLHPGIAATLVLPEYTGVEFPAQLVRSAGAVDAQSGSVLVQLEAENPDHRLKPGAFTQVHFRTSGATDAVSLPGSTVLYGTNGPTVVIVKPDNTVELRPVTITRDDGSKVRLAGNLALSDRVVDSPPDAIQAGEQVRVTQVLHPDAAAGGGNAKGGSAQSGNANGAPKGAPHAG